MEYTRKFTDGWTDRHTDGPPCCNTIGYFGVCFFSNGLIKDIKVMECTRFQH